MPIPSLFVTGFLDARIKGQLLSLECAHHFLTPSVSQTLVLSAWSIAVFLH